MFIAGTKAQKISFRILLACIFSSLSLIHAVVSFGRGDGRVLPETFRNFYNVPIKDFDLQCTIQTGRHNRGRIIENGQEYEQLIAESQKNYPYEFLPCAGHAYPEIDFSDKTLLGYMTHITGCDARYERLLLRNDESEEMVYYIKATEIGRCERIISSDNWILVPKIPAGYKVLFKFETVFEEQNIHQSPDY